VADERPEAANELPARLSEPGDAALPVAYASAKMRVIQRPFWQWKCSGCGEQFEVDHPEAVKALGDHKRGITVERCPKCGAAYRVQRELVLSGASGPNRHARRAMLARVNGGADGPVVLK